jgi:WD40 repeat protein
MRRRHYLTLALLALGTLGALLPAADDAAPPGLVLSLRGHKEAVYGITFSPDGKQLLTASGDPSVKVWDGTTGKEIKTFAGTGAHTQLVLAVSVSPDGSQFATGSGDNTLRVWDFPTSKPLRSFDLLADSTAVAVSADGIRLAGGGKDGKIRLWNTADGKVLFDLSGHTGAVTGLTFSPNGQLLISSGEDQTLRFWNPTDGKPVAHFAAHSAPVTGLAVSPNSAAVYTLGGGNLAFWSLPPAGSKILQTLEGPVTTLAASPDGSQILTSTGKLIRIINSANGQPVRQLSAPGDITSAALAPAAGLTAVGTADRQLVVWGNKEGPPLAQVVAHGKPVTGLAFNPAGNQLVSASADGQVKVWVMPPVPTRSLPHPEAVRSAAVAGAKHIVSGAADKIVRLWNLDNLKMPERQFTGHTGAVNAVAASADGQFLASAGDDETIRVWNRTKGEQVALIGAHSGPVTSLAYSPAGLVLSSSADGSVKLWQMQPAAAKNLMAHAGAVTSAVLTPDAGKLVTGCADKQVRVWNLTNGQVEKTFPGPTLGVQAVAVSARGDQVAAGGADRTLWVWEMASGKEVKKFAGLTGVVASVAFSPDGKILAAGLGDGTARLFDLAAGKEVQKLGAAGAAVTGVAFSLKGDVVYSSGADKVVRAWGVADGKEKAALDHGSPVTALALSRDGTRLASAGADKSIKVWNLADNKPAAPLTVPADVLGLNFAPDGKRLAVASADGRARVVDLADGTVAEYLPHEGPVHAVVFAPDGKHVVTASADKTARNWPLALVWSGRHAGPVRKALWSPRGDRVISVGDDKTVKSWAVADGKELKPALVHEGPIVDVGISADGAKLATASADRTVRIWDLAGKTPETPVAKLPLPGVPLSLAFSPNGGRVAVGFAAEKGGKERTLVLDALSGKELMTLGEAEGVPAGVLSFLPDSRTLLAAGNDRTVQLLDVNVQSAFEAHAGGVTGLVMHGNGTQVLTGGADRTVKLWTLATGKLERTFGPLTEPVSALTLSRDGLWVAAAGGKSVTTWTVADGKEVLTLPLPSAVNGLSFAVDRSRLATAGADGRVRVWDTATKLELQGFPHEGAVRGVTFQPANNAQLISAGVDKNVVLNTVGVARVVNLGGAAKGLTVTPSGTHVLTAGADGKVKVWNTGNGNLERTFETGDKPVEAVAVRRDGQLVAAASADGKVRLYNFNDPKLLTLLSPPAAVRSLAFAPSNQALVGACGDGSVVAWDVIYNPGQPLPAEFGKVVQTFTQAAVDLAFPTANANFYSAGGDKTIKGWKLASETATRQFAHGGPVSAVAFNPAGTLVAGGVGDGRLRIYDLAKGALQKDVAAHGTPAKPEAIYCLAWSPDGTQVVTGSLDHSLKLWNATSGALVREFRAFKEKEFPKGHQEAVLSVAFSPDGKQIASGSMDKTIKIWNVADGNVVRDLTNPEFKPAGAGLPEAAHPGWVYALRWLKDGKLISAGGAPRLRGYLAVWDTATGKLVSGQELGVGTIFALAVSPDEKLVALGTGGSVRLGPELNQGVVLKIPGGK